MNPICQVAGESEQWDNDARVAHELAGDRKLAAAGAVLFAAGSIACAVLSKGFLTADALTHFLYAKYAFCEPILLVDVWGRPLVTALYAVPASLGGRLAVRLTSLALAFICAATAYRIAKGQGARRPALAALFTLAQPLVFLNSFAEMTELPFASLAGLAFLAYQSRHWWTASALAALLPLARPEGFEFVALAALGLFTHRRFLPLLVLPFPLFLWSYAGWVLDGRLGPWWRWLPDHWPYARESTYPAGTVFQFILFLPAVVSPFIFPAMLCGAWQSLFSDRDCDVRQSSAARHGIHVAHERVCRIMTVVIPFSILIVHSLLYGLGKMASFGEPRYLLVAAPFWAVLSARGWEWGFARLRWPFPAGWALAAAVLPAVVLAFYPVLPLRRPAHWEIAEKVAARYRDTLAPAGFTKILAAHPAVFYYLDISPMDAKRIVEWRRESVANRQPGTVLVWDPIYSVRNAHSNRVVTLDDIQARGWVEATGFEDALREPESVSRRPTPDPSEQLASPGRWVVFVSPPAPLPKN